MSTLTNEFGLLHVKLADILGDSRTTGNVPIANVSIGATPLTDTTCDGIRYTSLQRSRWLNESIKWVMSILPIELIVKLGIGFSASTTAYSLLQQETKTSISSNTSTAMTYKILRLISCVDTTAGQVVPISGYGKKDIARQYHAHWANTVMLYPLSNQAIKFATYTGSKTFIVNYIQDINYSSDVDIGLGMFESYVLAHASALAKLSSQQFQEGLIIDKQTLEQLQMIKG